MAESLNVDENLVQKLTKSQQQKKADEISLDVSG